MTWPEFDVLGTTRYAVDRARSVRIDGDRLRETAERLALQGVIPPLWDRTYHYTGSPEDTAQYLLVLDAMNFSFWGEPRWRIYYGDEVLDGYQALAAALKRAVEEGTVPILDAGYLAEMPQEDLEDVLSGEGVIPLFNARWQILRETGQVLTDRYGDHVCNLISEAGGSAVRLVELLAADFPSFRDVATYQGHEVQFFKRAQIYAADLHGALDGEGYGSFRDLDRLTAFADYKLPQILREWGILVYGEDLARRVDTETPIEAGSEEEIEIRACTIWAVEGLRGALAERGVGLLAVQLDWTLWEASQDLQARPYHRTRTIFY